MDEENKQEEFIGRENDEEPIIDEASEEKAQEIEPLLSWEVQEHVYDRGLVWYILFGFFFVALDVYFLWSSGSRQWSAAIVITMLGIVYFIYLNRTPEMTVCNVTTVGIEFNDRFYSYTDLYSFGISYGNNKRTLQLLTNKRYMYIIEISIPDNLDPVMLRSLLIKHIPEQSFSQDILEKISRILKI